MSYRQATSERSCSTSAVGGKVESRDGGSCHFSDFVRKLGQGLEGHLSSRGQDHPDLAGQMLEKKLAQHHPAVVASGGKVAMVSCPRIPPQ